MKKINETHYIDFFVILKTLWNGRKVIKKIILVFFILGCFNALTSPVVYESHTTFVPQTSDYSSNVSYKSLGSLAQLAGLNLSAESSSSLDNYISPLLYEQIFSSEEFSLNIVNEYITSSNLEKLTLKEYIITLNEFSILGIIFQSIGFIKENTIGLLFKDSDESLKSDLFTNYKAISKEDYNIIKKFKNMFSIELNEKEGYIKVIGRDKDPIISSQIVNLVTKNLQQRIISLRTSKIKEQLDYSSTQYNLKRVEFENLQNKLAEFVDSNKNISTAVIASEQQRLQSEVQLQQNILLSLASEYNNNKIKLNKNTPIFSVLDEVSVPIEKSKPRTILIVILYTLSGLFFSIIYVFLKDPIKEIIDTFKTK